MRVVAGSDRSRNFRQAELDRHLEAMSRFVERHDGTHSPRCTMVLRSAASTPAQVLILMKDALLDAAVEVQVILAKLEPTAEFRQLLATLTALSPDRDAAALIRWARNPRLLEAHEQVTYGTAMSWSGDAMRRDADKRNPLALFEMDVPEAVRRSAHAFAALWEASVPVPDRHLAGRAPEKSVEAFDEATNGPVAVAQPHLKGWPLVRH